MKRAFLFPGQGAQYPGMAKDFYSSYPIARETFEAANEILGRDIASIILEGPVDKLTETKNSQTGIYVASWAILKTVQHLFPELKPTFCAGLSLGEYTAASAAGYFTFEKGLQLVQYRGTYMNEACEKNQGFMAVVLGLEGEQVEKIVKEAKLPQDLWAANFNCPGQVVISGTAKGIEIGTNLVKAKGAKRVLPLQVHGAFHSGLMIEAQERLGEHLFETSFTKPHAQLVMNVSGMPPHDFEEARELLFKQVTHPVRWEQSIRTLEASGIELYIEMGPGKTLAGFNKRIGVQAPTISVEKVEDLKFLEEALCKNC